MDPILRFEGVSLAFGPRTVLHDVTFSVPRGAFLGIVGPNGSGKTTLLRAALGTLLPKRGRVVRAAVGSRPLRVGYVPQRLRLDSVFPLRVRDVVLMGRYAHVGPLRGYRDRDRQAADAACERLAIESLRDKPYRDLSGGQQQRVLIARALAAEPELLALDEPTNGMDLPAEHSIMEIVTELAEQGSSVLFVTHQLNLVADAASDLALLHEGTLRVGPRSEVLTVESLSELYGVPVEVHSIEGRTLITAVRGAR